MTSTSPAKGAIRRGAVLLTVWQLARVGQQAVWMVLIARMVGASGYGTFAGYAGLAASLGALTGLGFGLTLLQDVSRDRSRFPVALHHAFLALLCSGVLLWIVFVVLSGHLLSGNISLLATACIGIPELIAFPATILASYAYQAHERPGMAGAMYALVPTSNLLAIGIFFLSGVSHTLTAYLPFHAATSAVAAIVGWQVMRWHLRPGRTYAMPTRRDVIESASFSLMRLIDTGMVSLDKSLVLRLAGPEIAGWYTAAFRLASVLAIPISALAMAALPRLFREHYRQGASPLTRTLLVVSLGAGAIACVAMLASSGALPWLLGHGFDGAATAARYLFLAPLLIGLTAIGSNVLATSDRRRYRIISQLCGLGALCTLAFLLIPHFGVGGAAGMLQGALLVTSVMIWLAVFQRRSSVRKESHRDEPDPPHHQDGHR